jgi:hypothetical protein
MGTFNFKAPVELWATMKDVARQEGISVSEMIRRAVAEWLQRQGVSRDGLDCELEACAALLRRPDVLRQAHPPVLERFGERNGPVDLTPIPPRRTAERALEGRGMPLGMTIADRSFPATLCECEFFAILGSGGLMPK